MIPRRRLQVRVGDVFAAGRAVTEPESTAYAAVRAFELAFARFVGVPYAHACASGRDAILLAFHALGLLPGDEILVPAYTLGELMPLLQGAGYVPVPVDVEHDSFNMDPEQMVSRIGVRTRGVLPAHIFGAPCDMARILAVARAHKLVVVEDCAHAPGATIGGQAVGSFGDAAIFSLESNKMIAAYGGGVLVSVRDDVHERVAAALRGRVCDARRIAKKVNATLLEEAAIRSPLYGLMQRVLFSPWLAPHFEKAYRRSHDRVRGVPVAYSGFQARLAQGALASLPERQRDCSALWQRMVDALPPGCTTQVRDRVGTPVFYNLVVRVTDVETARLRDRLRARGIDVGIGSEVMDDCAVLLGDDDCANAAAIVREGVLLPCYDGMSEQACDRVVAALGACR